MPPTGKKNPKAKVARTACAVIITRPRSAYWEGIPPPWPPPLLLLLDPPPKLLLLLLLLESELELESDESPPL